MRKLFSNIFSAYSKSFYISIVCILAALIFIFTVRTFSDDVQEYALRNTRLLAEEMESELSYYSDVFELYAKTFESTANTYSNAAAVGPESMETIVAPAFWCDEIKSVFFVYLPEGSSQSAQAYYTDGSAFGREEIEASVDLSISKSEWTDISWINGTDAEMAYVVPVKPEGHDVLAGFTPDFGKLVESVGREREYGGYMLLCDGNGSFYSYGYNNPKSELPSIDDVILKELQKGAQSGSFKAGAGGTDWVISYFGMGNGIVLADAVRHKDLVKGSNDILYVLAASAVFCLWLVQKNKKTGYTPFERISEMLMEKYKDRLSNVELNSNRAAHALHMGLVLTVTFYTFYAITVNATLTVLAVHTGIIAVGCSTMMIYRRRAISRSKAFLLVGLSLLIPLGMHFFEGGFAYRNPGSSLLWIVAGILMALFLIGVTSARVVFSLFILLLFLSAMAEMTVLKNHNYELIFSFISGLFFLGFSLYASIRTYIMGSQEDYIKITDLLEKLKASRNVEIQQAKMATLGQLIAGVSHEINTPIGAIQAAGENMDAVLGPNLDYLFIKARQLSDEELELLVRIVDAGRASMAEMKSTSELRKARREIQAYLSQEEVPDSAEIAAKLTQLEICDIDFVASEKEMLKSGRIAAVMDILDKLAPLITGTQTILMATGKVSKIMFALKRYSYTSGSDRHESFDIVDSIDNILILHTNLLKSGITIVKNIAPDTPKVLGSVDEIGQVWTNLIHNAVYAMNGVGTLTIGATVEGNTVRVSVGDTGTGIEKENLPKIFDAFYTSKPVGEGTGLGLDICRKIIENHQGRIWVESEVGKGTTFYVELTGEAAVSGEEEICRQSAESSEPLPEQDS